LLQVIILLIDYGAPQVGLFSMTGGVGVLGFSGMGLSILMPKLTKWIRKSVCTAVSRVAVMPKVKVV